MAATRNHRVVLTRQKGSVTLWAWIASVVVHLIVLAVFAVVRFSNAPATSAPGHTPTASVKQIKKYINADHVIPKPAVKRPIKTNSATSTKETFSINRIFNRSILKPGSLNNHLKPSMQTAVGRIDNTISSRGTEFFGSWTSERRICYVVDSSGSMWGVFGRVREKLKDSIAKLQPDQYFDIIFFGTNRLFEFGKGRMVRATKEAKADASGFIDSASPAGQTNAMAALERALKIRDNNGQGASVIYFLTDGFELTTQDASRFSRKTAELLKRFAPNTQINTIAFWPAGDDRKMLETIARQSNGSCIIVTDSEDN